MVRVSLWSQRPKLSWHVGVGPASRWRLGTRGRFLAPSGASACVCLANQVSLSEVNAGTDLPGPEPAATTAKQDRTNVLKPSIHRIILERLPM